MSIGLHTPDDIQSSSHLNIDLKFAQIVRRDEQGSLGTACPEYVKEM
jgi:hypothetical protein